MYVDPSVSDLECFTPPVFHGSISASSMRIHFPEKMLNSKNNHLFPLNVISAKEKKQYTFLVVTHLFFI